MADSHVDRDFVEYILKAIVSHPEEITVTRTVDDLGVLLTISAHPDDMGTIIGKNGQTAKSIRTLLHALGSKSNERVNMKILEPEGSVKKKAEEENPAADSASDELPTAEEVAAAEAASDDKN